jgi:hypothetical protein
MTDKLKSLSKTKRILLGIGAFTLLASFVGMGSPQEKKLNTEKEPTISQLRGESTDQKPKSKIETQMVEEKIVIPYGSSTQDDPSLDKGKTLVIPGVNGEKVIVYKVTYANGVETNRAIESEMVLVQPVNEIKKIGTKASTTKMSTNCNPNYSGACVPVASDVDCAGGSGNGPAYVSGPVYVTGSDPYDLDRDGDSVACE